MRRRTVFRITIGIGGFLALIGLLVLSDPLLRQIIFHPCSPDERWDYAVPGDGRYTVSYYERNCALIGAAPEEGVFAERSRVLWPWPERKYIFRYEPTHYYSGAVQVIPTGPNSVTLSTGHLPQVFLAETTWQSLKIDYNIGSIQNFRPTDPNTVGEAWAERENALAESAWRMGIPTSVNRDPAPLGRETSPFPR